MNLFINYVKEREGNEVLIDDQGRGFVEFRLLGETLIIEGLHVEKAHRRQGVGTGLMARVIAGNPSAKFLFARVGTHFLNATESLAACLGYGFKLCGLDGTYILLSKEIENG